MLFWVSIYAHRAGDKPVPTLEDLKRYVSALESRQEKLIEEIEKLAALRDHNSYIYRRLLNIVEGK